MKKLSAVSSQLSATTRDYTVHVPVNSTAAVRVREETL